MPGAADAGGAARARGQGRGRCPRSSRRCSPRSATRRSTAPDWMWEPKLDGYRVLAFIDEDGVKLRSRRGLELAPQVPAARRGARASRPCDGMILDGELVAFDADGKPSFGALQDRAQLKTEREIAAADQSDRRWSSSASTCCTSPASICATRRTRIAGAISRSACCRRRCVQLVHAAEDGIALHAAALASGFEGVIGKRKESRYEAGRRSASWLKVKPTQSADFVIGGYTQGQGLARAARRAPRRLLGRRASCATPRTSARASTSARSTQVKARLEPLQRKHLPVRREAGAQRPDDVGRAEDRRRGELPELDRRRSPARAGVPAPARRRRCPRTCGAPALGSASRTTPTEPAARSTTSSRSSRARRRRSRSPSGRIGSASRTSIASTGRPIRRSSSRRSPSATCCATSRRSRRTCCRTSPIARSR